MNDYLKCNKLGFFKTENWILTFTIKCGNKVRQWQAHTKPIYVFNDFLDVTSSQKLQKMSNNDMWAFVLMNILTFGIMNVKIWFDNTCLMNSSLHAYLAIRIFICYHLTFFLVQSRGGSPLSPFLDHLGSPPPAHMSALRSVHELLRDFASTFIFQSGFSLSFSPSVCRGLR